MKRAFKFGEYILKTGALAPFLKTENVIEQVRESYIRELKLRVRKFCSGSYALPFAVDRKRGA